MSVNFGGNPPVATRTVRGSNPTFNEELIIPVTEPSMANRIRIAVEDYNSVRNNAGEGYLVVSAVLIWPF